MSGRGKRKGTKEGRGEDGLTPRAAAGALALAFLFLGGLLALLYLPAFSCPLFFDETRLILDVPYVQTGQLFDAFRFHPTRAAAVASYIVTYAWAGDQPEAWRISELALHLLVAVALGLVVWRAGAAMPPRARLAWTAGAGALFALHPLAVEPALYAWARPTLFYTLLALAGADCLMRHDPAGPVRKRLAMYALLCLYLLLSLVCKEVAPVVLALFFAAGVVMADRGAWRTLAAGLGALAAGGFLAIVWLMERGGARHLSHAMEIRLQGKALLEHLWIQTRSFPEYMKLLLPLPNQYAISHVVLEPVSLWPAALSLLCLGLLAALFLLALRRGRRLSALGLALLFFSLLPYLILPSRPLVEYKAYPALAGAVLAIAGAAFPLRAGQGGKASRIPLIAMLLLIAWASLLTFRQARIWRSPERVWRHAARVYALHPEAKTQVGVFLMDRGEMEESWRWLKAAADDMYRIKEEAGGEVPLYQNWSWTSDTMGEWQFRMGNWEMAERYWRAALKLDPGQLLSHVNLARLKVRQRRWEEARELLAEAHNLARDVQELSLVQAVEEELAAAAPREGN